MSANGSQQQPIGRFHQQSHSEIHGGDNPEDNVEGRQAIPEFIAKPEGNQFERRDIEQAIIATKGVPVVHQPLQHQSYGEGDNGEIGTADASPCEQKVAKCEGEHRRSRHSRQKAEIAAGQVGIDHALGKDSHDIAANAEEHRLPETENTAIAPDQRQGDRQ